MLPKPRRPPWASKFLEELATPEAGGNVLAACQRLGLGRHKPYRLAERDDEWAALFVEAKQKGQEGQRDSLAYLVYTRAMNPLDKSGHLLAMFILKKLDNSYRDSHQPEARPSLDYYIDLSSGPDGAAGGDVALESP